LPGDTVVLPDIATLPTPGVIVTDVASETVQLNFEELPNITDPGLEEKEVIVGNVGVAAGWGGAGGAGVDGGVLGVVGAAGVGGIVMLKQPLKDSTSANNTETRTSLSLLFIKNLPQKTFVLGQNKAI
jgi:hypothetical protein